MNERTKTYIAGDWTGDNNAITQLYYWAYQRLLNHDFQDAHEEIQSKDSSLNCSIKKSLGKRLDISHTFVLVVGNDTISLRAGECSYCEYYNSCTDTSNKSYIEYECDKALNDKLKIIVLYNSTTVDRQKCPSSVRYAGNHSHMIHIVNGQYEWDYWSVNYAFR